jgi:SAM-dependent methyltransferase
MSDSTETVAEVVRADPKCTTRKPAYAELSRVFYPYSKSQSDLRRFCECLESHTPQPPPYVWWHVARLVTTFQFLAPLVKTGHRWLDISSDPWFCLLAAKEFKGAELVPTAFRCESLPLWSENGETAYAYEPRPLVVSPDSTDFAVGQDFDLVTAFELLEHLQFHPAPFLCGLNNALRLGGRVLLSTPNGTSWGSVNALLEGGAALQTYRFGGDMTHRAEYSTWEIKILLESAGFKVESIHTRNVYPTDQLGVLANLLWLGLVGWHGLTLQAKRVRNLLFRAGSTMFVCARKVGPCDVSKVVRI